MDNLLDKIEGVDCRNQEDLDRIVTGALASMPTFHGPAAHVAAQVVAEGKAEQAMTDGNAEAMAEHDAEFEDIEGGQA